MNNSAFSISKRIYSGLLMLATICFASCSLDNTDDFPGPEPAETSDYFRVGASVASNVYTRNRYIKDGEVDEGDFVLTYPYTASIVQGDISYTYRLADVRFGEEGLSTTGFVTHMKDNKLVELKWNDIYIGTTTTNASQTAVFYLDNVPDDLNNPAINSKDDHRVVFYEDVGAPEGKKNPFVAGVFDEKNGTNDLLWGTQEAANLSKKVDFKLHHNMSRVRVIIDVEPRDDNHAMVDLRKVAKLEITNLYLRPEEFDRTNGNLILPLNLSDNEQENTLTLVDINSETGENVMEWGNIFEDFEEGDEELDKITYTTKDFVLPPQSVVNTSDRPKLRLTVPAKYADVDRTDEPVIFEVSLPQTMYEPSQPGETSPPKTFSFLKEHILTIRAKVGPPQMELEFAPVQVEDWVDLGEYQITGNQAGIYNNDDFNDFVDCYLRKNDVRLEKYGYTTSQSNGQPDKWTIMFWSRTVSVDYDEILGKLKVDENDEEYKTFFEEHPFAFSFNNYEIGVTGRDGVDKLSGAAGQIMLYNWLTGLDLPLPGIGDANEFLAMITAYNTGSTSTKQQYGAYDNTNEQWVFEFTEKADPEITLSYNDIRKTMNFTDGGNFSIKFRGHTVRVTDMPGGREDLVLSGDEGELILHAMVAASDGDGGIYSPDDVDLLIKAYNQLAVSDDNGGDNGNESGSKLDLSWLVEEGHFGTKAANGSWTFKFMKPMELDGPKIYGTMVPDSSKGLPDYTFNLNSMVVKVADTGTYVYQPSVGNLKKLFANGGQATTVAELKNIITYANNGNPIYRRYYGWYNEPAKLWEYPINGTFSISYEDLWKKLTSTEPLELILVGESKVTVTGLKALGVEEDTLICRGRQGAEMLLKIMRGTYEFDELESGIEIPGDFAELFTAYNSNNTAGMSRFGSYDEAAGKWVFGFTSTSESQIEVPYSALHGKIQADSAAGDFEFDFGSHTVKITGLPGGDPDSIVLSGSDKDQALFRAILTEPGQISSPADVTWLMGAYNGAVSTLSLSAGSYVPASTFSLPMSNFSYRSSAVTPLVAVSGNFDWIYGLYGNKNGNAWTFIIGNSIRLRGSEIYGMMIPGGDKPDYEFSYVSDSGVQVVDGEFPAENVIPANLKKLFAQSGAIASATDLSGMITAAASGNSVTGRYYGRKNADKWEYTVAESLSRVDFQAIRGTLKDIAEFDLLFANESVAVELINLPRGYRPVDCIGSEGAQTLYSILRDTYPEPVTGLKSNDDVEAMITAYRSSVNSDELWIYGTNPTGSKWNFVFLKSLSLTADAICGKMTPSAGYEFEYGPGVSITVTDGAASVSDMAADKLRMLFSAEGVIATAADLTNMLSANAVERRYYGRKDASGKWIFPISGTFSIAYDTFKGQLAGETFETPLEGGVVTVTGLPGSRQVVCSGADGAQTLHDILAGTYKPRAGIELASDITSLISAYPNNESELEIYGTKEGEKWKFIFRASMSLVADAICGKMTPSTGYEFEYDPGVSITVTDGAASISAMAAEKLRVLFSAEGVIATAADLTNMLSANAVERRYYGRKDASGKWSFPISGTFSIAYDSLDSKLTGETFEMSLEGRAVVTVTGVPTAETDVTESLDISADNVETLYEILKGTYTPPVPPSTGDDGDDDNNGGGSGSDPDPETQP
ncbi:MAG: hypothetical protein J1E04_01495 [Alistipes sp.]|nr:hypothetical protein [Alistipes sp.]